MEEEIKKEVENVEEVEPIPDPDIEGEIIGNIKIAVDVVSTIAGIAADEIEGVANMYSTFAGGIVEKLSKKNASKGVRVEMNEDSVIIDLYMIVDYGVKIPELAWEVQENVKSSVETMTGLDVEKVNIHIEGISFEKEKARLIAENERAAELAQIESEAEDGGSEPENVNEIND